MFRDGIEKRGVSFTNTREGRVHDLGCKPALCRDKAQGPATYLPAPRDGSGHAQTWRTASGSEFAGVGSPRRWWKRNAKFPSNRKENRSATAGMDKKQARTETAGNVCCPTHSTLKGDLDGRPSKRRHHTRIHGLGGDGFFRGGIGNEGIVPLAPKNARENAHKKPAMIACLDGGNCQG